jgi:hypothetical protein
VGICRGGGVIREGVRKNGSKGYQVLIFCDEKLSKIKIIVMVVVVEVYELVFDTI